MRRLRALVLRLTSLLGRERGEREIADELESHIQLHVDDNVRAGMTPAEARRRALMALGGLEQAKERYRDRRGMPWLDALLQDTRFSLRTLRKQKVFTLVAVTTLAVGFGPPIAIFALANRMVLRPVGGVQDSGVVAYYMSGTPIPGGVRIGRISYLNLQDVLPRLRTLEMAGFQGFSQVTVGGNDRPDRFVTGQFVSASYFGLLGVDMQAGRPLGPADDDPRNPALTAVISDRLWASLFDRSPSAVGRTITVNGRAVTIVGVAGRDFHGVRRFQLDDLWLPGVSEPLVRQLRGRRADDRATGGYYQFVGRLVAGATWQQADAELATMIPWLREQFPSENGKLSAIGFHNQGVINSLGRQQLVSLLAVMFGASVLVLLIASSNVASLLLMRGVTRRDEVALRQALGAGRGRVMRQHVTEASLLWLVGAVGGTLIVWGVLRAGLISRLSVIGVPDLPVPLDGQAFAFAGLLALVIGILFSLVPAWATTKVRLGSAAPAVTTIAGRRFRLAPVLTAVQLSASLGLLVGALMLGATVRNLLAVDLGFDPALVTTFRITAPVGATPETAYTYVNEFRTRLAARPGVESVTVAPGAPFAGAVNFLQQIRPAGEQEFTDILAEHLSSPEYFTTLRIPLRSGRTFAASELAAPGRPRTDYVVVNETLARRLFGTLDVIGSTVEMPAYQRAPEAFSIIGVVKDVRYLTLDEPPPPVVYRPDGSTFLANGATAIVRSRESPLPIEEVERIAAALGSPLPPAVRTLDAAIARARGEWDVLAALMAILATIASMVAGVGVYGVAAFAAASRRSEFGIRMALGASVSNVRRQVLGGAAALTISGLVLGSAGAYALMRVLRARLVGVSELDPLVWASAALILIVLVAVASVVPARSASRLNLVDTLKAT
jgi:predicted permease